MNILPHAQAAARGCAEILPVQPANIPEQLRQVPQWLVWRLKPNGNKKPKKVPVHPKTGRKLDATNRGNLMGFDGAVSVYLSGKAHGIGFAFTPTDPFAGVDLDACRNPATGELDPSAESLLRELDTYAEVSVSGTGVHALAVGALDPAGPKHRDGIELYDRARYFTFTGHRLTQARATVEDRELILRAIQDRLRARHGSTQSASAGNGFDGADTELLAIAFAAKNGAKVCAYWNGNRMGKPSASEALLGLARLLAFYTGPDEARLERLITRSSLFAATEKERPKWSSARRGGTWGVVYVVRKAISTCAAFYQPAGVRLPFFSPTLNSPPTCVSTYGHPPRTSSERLQELCHTLAKRHPQGRFYLSERTASRALGVSKTAVHKALARLLAKGVIVRTRKGTYRNRKNSAFLLRECSAVAA